MKSGLDLFSKTFGISGSPENQDAHGGATNGHRLLKSMMQTVETGAWRYDLATGRVEADDTLLEIYGLTPETFGNDYKIFQQAVHHADRDATRPELIARQKSDEVEAQTLRILRPTGETRTVMAWTLAERDETGNVVALYGLQRDVTEELAMSEDRLRGQSVLAQAKMAGRIAHDLSNALAVIEGAAELAGTDRPDDSNLQLIQRATDTGRDLVGQLLSLGRRDTAMPNTVEAPEFLRELDRMLARVLPESILLRYRSAPDVGGIRVDRAKLEEAILFLALRTRDLMPNGGVITIETGNATLQRSFFTDDEPDLQPGPHVWLSVTDSGQAGDIGTAQAASEIDYWEHDAQAERSLQTVQKLIQNAGGALRVAGSRETGQTIRIYLPAVWQPKVVPNPRSSERVAVDRAGSILLVEDDPALCAVLERQLTRAGYRVDAKDSGEAAARALKGGLRPDVILTDWVLPGDLQGEALAQLANEMAPQAGIVLMSGFPGQIAPGKVSDETILLRKPAPFRKLIGAIDSALSRRSGT